MSNAPGLLSCALPTLWEWITACTDSPMPVPTPPTATPKALTARQFDVLRLLARGLPNKLIARALAVSESTVKVHLLAIFRALGVHNRTHAVIAAQKNSGPTAMRPKRPECQGAGARISSGQRAP